VRSDKGRSTGPTEPPAGKVLVARFGAAHGVRGEVRLWSFTQDPLAVADYGPLETADGSRTFVLESLRPQQTDRLVARVAGVSNRDTAEQLRNLELYVPRGRLPPLDEDGTWYISDLIGLAAQDANGAPVGKVAAVHNFGAGDIVEIVTAEGPAIMLPFTAESVPEVDVAAGHIVVVVPKEDEDVAGDGPHDLS
jgi:16S rRNA processing protein RimM